MKFFLDTEFIERGREHPLTLISIGVVDQQGHRFYAVSSEFKEEDCNPWLKKNVLPYIKGQPRLPVATIAEQLKKFITENSDPLKPEFWGYYADYDWVILCQMFGAMIDLPEGWPMYCNDVKQLAMSKGNPRLPMSSVEHNALMDALQVKHSYEFLMGLGG